ncbi:hypothetical protein RB195_021047 [Necator americanus]|uniref:FZ domain-containing protein n=1 Tax=Necator americanus TaxID=51031 RepID=A0ABR1E969_NECAM
MRLFSFFVLPALCQGIGAKLQEHYEDVPDDFHNSNVNHTISKNDAETHADAYEILQHFRHCRGKEWMCDKDCRLEFWRETKQCRRPNPGDNCFGAPVDYKYTRDFVSDGVIPHEFGVLRRYPRCWSYLAPVICAVIFRPCSLHSYIEKDNNGSVKNGTVELWQLLGSSSCRIAHDMCDDVISVGLFPSFVSVACRELKNISTIENSRSVFSNNCQHASVHFPVQVEPGSCPWPLISEPESMDLDVSPVLDNCFLPCRVLKIRIRPLLMLCVYGVSATFSSLITNTLRENDGVSGVCYNGLLTWWKYLISVFPLLVLFFIIVSLGVVFIGKREAAEDDTPVGCVDLGQSSLKCKREDSVPCLPGSLQQRYELKYETSCFVSKRLDRVRDVGVSSIWTGMSFVFFTIFLFGSPIVHFCYVGVSAEHEIRSIINYVNCGTAHVIQNRSLDWNTFSDSSLLALREASWCSLPFEQAQGRLEGVMVVFIILPLLPFVVLLFAFLADVNGYRGMSKIRNRAVDSNMSTKCIGDQNESCELALVRSSLEMEQNEFTNKPKVELDVEKTAFRRAAEEVVDTDQSKGDEGTVVIANEDHEYQEEFHKEFLDIIHQLQGELAFQQLMLVNNGAAFNICLHCMERSNQLLSSLKKSVDPGSVPTQDLCALGEEVSHVLPSVTDHAMQLSRWMNSIQEACLKIECIRGVSGSQCHSFFGAKDIERQRQLLALNDYLSQTVRSSVREQADFPENFENQQKSFMQKVRARLPSQDTSKQEHKKVQELFGNTMKHQNHVKNLQCDEQPGSSRKEDNVAETPTVSNVQRDHSQSENNTVGQQSHEPRRLLRISAYAESYCATPRGIVSRLTVPELRIRIRQIKNICAGDSLYPQELSYMLLVTGDIAFGGNIPREEYFFYPIEQLPHIFGTNVPSIDARIGVQEFLSHMRRRALCVVAAIGYHFSLRSRRESEYTPPVLPPLGLYRSENELILRRVLGDRDEVLPCLREFLQEFQFGRGPVVPRPDLKFASAFGNYLRLVAAREGFNNDHEDYVPDPLPPPGSPNDFEETNNSARSDESDMDPMDLP